MNISNLLKYCGINQPYGVFSTNDIIYNNLSFNSTTNSATNICKDIETLYGSQNLNGYFYELTNPPFNFTSQTNNKEHFCVNVLTNKIYNNNIMNYFKDYNSSKKANIKHHNDDYFDDYDTNCDNNIDTNTNDDIYNSHKKTHKNNKKSTTTNAMLWVGLIIAIILLYIYFNNVRFT